MLKPAIILVLGILAPRALAVAGQAGEDGPVDARSGIESGIIGLHRELNAVVNEMGSINRYGAMGSDFAVDHRVTAQDALKRAVTQLAAGSYLAAIQDFQYFLAVDQQSVPLHYLSAHEGLAKSFEALGLPSKAHQHYLSYVDTALSTGSQNIAGLLSAYERAVNIEVWGGLQVGDSAEKYISRLKTMRLERDEDRDTLRYVLGKFYHGKGDDTASQEYFLVESKKPLQPSLLGRALYLSGLMQVKAGDLEKAEHYLRRALEEGSVSDRDLHALGLARLQAHRKRYDHALRLYSRVPADSKFRAEALLETVQTALLLRDMPRAKEAAEDLVKGYPATVQAKSAERMLGYIHLHLGEFQEARKYIEASERQMNELRAWIREIGAASSIDAAVVAAIYDKLDLILPQSPVLRSAHGIFGGIREARIKINMAKAELGRQYSNLSRQSLDDANPYWSAKSAQLEDIGARLTLLGNELAVSEKTLYAEQVSRRDQVRLASLSKLVLMLSAGRSLADGRYENWRHQYNYLMLLGQASTMAEKAGDIKARLAAAVLADANTTRAPGRGTTASGELRGRLADLEEKMSKTVFGLNSDQAQLDLETTRTKTASRDFVRSSLLLDEMDDILRKYRESKGARLDQTIIGDIADGWSRWRSACQELIIAQKKLSDGYGSRVSGMVASAQDLYRRLEADEKRLDGLAEDASRTLGAVLGAVTGHYEAKIDELSAVNRRWLGDLEWLRYEEVKRGGARVKDEHEARKQEIIDRLTEINMEQMW